MAGGKTAAAKTKKKPPAKVPAKTAVRTVGKTKSAARSAVAKSKPPAKSAARTSARSAPKAKPAPRSAAPSKAKPRVVATATRRQTPSRAAAKGGLTLDKLQQVSLTATNLEAAVHFYRDTLGLRFVKQFDQQGLAFFNLGGGLRLLLSAGVSNSTLYFHVDDIDAAQKELRKRGVQFLQPPHMIYRDDEGDFGKKGTEEWMAFFRDPSGNTLALVERRH